MAEQAIKKQAIVPAKPILKWAGGKTQMLNDLLPKVPSSYGRYIEPFFGGGALFFALQPENAIISDSNPELINMYRQVADFPDEVIQCLKQYENTKEMFYNVRSQTWEALPKAEAAARTIFLNRTCFNGLYRVNKKGEFNVPYGKYKNPKICDQDALYVASDALKKAEILCGDYILVLEHYTKEGDFIFLDPPYLPVSEYSDFKRYTKEQFYEEDHIELAKIIARLHERGCHIILTNSNHPLVHELYSQFTIDVVATKRYISCRGSSRKGEDVIVTIPPKQKTLIKLMPQPLPKQVAAYPPTRFMGSKSKLLSEIWSVASQFKVDTVIDLFAGSGIVGYMFKAQGKSVISNDYMAMSATFAKAMIENNSVILPMQQYGIAYSTVGKDLDTPAHINQVRYEIEELIAEKKEEAYAAQQANQWQEIAAYMDLIASRKERMRISEDEEIRIPKTEAPAYLEWSLWRAFLAIDTLANKPYEVRRFKSDQDFMPVSTAPGNGPDLVAEFDDYVVVIEVTLSESSRQEAMEGEPVRRHVADLMQQYNQPMKAA